MKMVLRDLYENEIRLKVSFASIFSKNRQPGKLLFFTRKVNTVFFLLTEFKPSSDRKIKRLSLFNNLFLYTKFSLKPGRCVVCREISRRRPALEHKGL